MLAAHDVDPLCGQNLALLPVVTHVTGVPVTVAY